MLSRGRARAAVTQIGIGTGRVWRTLQGRSREGQVRCSNRGTVGRQRYGRTGRGRRYSQGRQAGQTGTDRTVRAGRHGRQ